MINRIRTSIDIADKLDILDSTFKLSSKAAVLRLAISLSLNDESAPKPPEDKKGFEIAIFTLLGDYFDYYRILISVHSKENLSDDEFEHQLICHIERGVTMLYSEYQLSGKLERIVDKLLKEYA